MSKAEDYIKKFGLVKHPEGGWYREAYRSPEIIRKEHLPVRFSGDRAHSTSIYFLLEGSDYSAFHRIKSDELWHFYDGDAVTIHMIDSLGKYSSAKLGRNINESEVFQLTVRRSTWFAAEVGKQNSFALVGCTVSPGFDFDDFEMGKREELLKLSPLNYELINRLALD